MWRRQQPLASARNQTEKQVRRRTDTQRKKQREKNKWNDINTGKCEKSGINRDVKGRMKHRTHLLATMRQYIFGICFTASAVIINEADMQTKRECST
jgi:hypothetical protein